MRRAVIYVLLLGILSGVVAGVATFGPPAAGGEGETEAGSPGILLGLGLHETALGAGVLAILLLAVLGLLDLRRIARDRRP